MCELKHLSNNVNNESNEIIEVTASETIIKIFKNFTHTIGELYVKKIYHYLIIKTKYDE